MSKEYYKGRLDFCDELIRKECPGGLKEYLQILQTEMLGTNIKPIDKIALDYIDLLFDYIEKLENNKN